jgi:protease I
MTKAIIIIGPGVEDSEFLYPYYRLLEAGLTVDVASKGKVEVRGKHGVPIAVNVDASGPLLTKDYELVLIPGGYESPDRVRQIPEVLKFVRAMDAEGKLVAAVCHGPWVLVSAGIAKGREMTCYPGCKDDLINAGAKYRAAPVVVDKNVITSPHFRDMAPWMKEIVARLKKQK